MQNLYEYKYMRDGLRATSNYLQNRIDIIERMEKNATRRYKLLKYIIGELMNDNETILKYYLTEPSKNGSRTMSNLSIGTNFIYRFEKGKLYVNNQQSK